MTEKQKRMIEHWKSCQDKDKGVVMEIFMADHELFCCFQLHTHSKPTYIAVTADKIMGIPEHLYSLCKKKTDVYYIKQRIQR